MIIISSVLSVWIISCSVKSEIFQHDIRQGATPWTGEPVIRSTDKFTFAVISDLNGGERDQIFDVAIEQINLLRPEFVLSVGDLIDGGTEDTVTLKDQFNRFDSRVAKLQVPFFHVGGNHDLTNPVMRTYWERRYGKRYYHFVYSNVLFLIMDSEDYSEQRMREIYEARARAIEVLDGPNPENARQLEYFKMPERVTGEIGDEQSAYFENVIAGHPEVSWTFVLMHKPVWKRETERNLVRVEQALGGRDYTVINGHLHAYSYTSRNNQDYVMLGTTGGAQNVLDESAFDHITLITMNADGPSIANLKLDGILDKTGKIPLGGDSLCFQAWGCR